MASFASHSRTSRLGTALFLLLLTGLTGCGEGPGAGAPPVLAFEGGRVIVGDGSAPIEDGVLLVQGDRILEIGARGSIQVPANAERIDASGRTLLPALVNTHMHLPGAYDALVDALEHLAYYGVGVAASLGMDAEGAIFDVRQTPIDGAARIRSAGRGITRPEPGRTEVPYWVTSEGAARIAVQEQAMIPVDLIKIWVDDRGGQYEKLGPDLYTPIIQEAHSVGLRVTAHIYALEDAKGLLRAGIDGFAHGIRDQDIDEELLALWQERPQVVLVPNLPDPGVAQDLSWLAGTVPAARLAELQAGSVDRPQARAGFDVQARNLMRINEAGLPIAFGTDGGIPWSAHQELEDMVRAGMAPMDVLVAATRNSARFLGITDTGTLEAGQIADLLILDGNPLADITQTRRISEVYLRGVRVDRDALSARFTAEP
jgi:imidazolonepropionase-like amidohydrolase